MYDRFYRISDNRKKESSKEKRRLYTYDEVFFHSIRRLRSFIVVLNTRVRENFVPVFAQTLHCFMYYCTLNNENYACVVDFLWLWKNCERHGRLVCIVAVSRRLVVSCHRLLSLSFPRCCRYREGRAVWLIPAFKTRIFNSDCRSQRTRTYRLCFARFA